MTSHSFKFKMGSVARIERPGPGVFRIRLHDSLDSNQITHALDDLLTQELGDLSCQVLFDMSNIDFPGSSFIALLIAWTWRLRKNSGDLKLVNVKETALHNLDIFSPGSYLTLGKDQIVKLDGKAVDREGLDMVPQGIPISLKIEAEVESLEQATRFVVRLAEQVGMDRIEISKLKIAVYEVCLNVIEHSYQHETGKEMEVEVLLSGKKFQVSVIDWGKPFDFYDMKPYNVHDAFEERRQGGFGLYIIKRSVEEIRYESDEETGNRLVMVKYL